LSLCLYDNTVSFQFSFSFISVLFLLYGQYKRLGNSSVNQDIANQCVAWVFQPTRGRFRGHRTEFHALLLLCFISYLISLGSLVRVGLYTPQIFSFRCIFFTEYYERERERERDRERERERPLDVRFITRRRMLRTRRSAGRITDPQRMASQMNWYEWR